MKHLLVIILTLGSAILITGCGTQASKGEQFNTSNVTLIKAGKTTKKEVLSYLGNPRTKVAILNGNEIWDYAFISKNVSSSDMAMASIPFIGSFHSIDYDKHQESVKIQFNGNLVVDCTYTTFDAKGTGIGAIGAAGLGDETSSMKTTKCGDSQSSNYYNPLQPTTTKEKIIEAQVLLNKHGYAAGRPDGIMGEKTRNAIMKFQQDNGLIVDGKISDILLSRLRTIKN